MKRTKHVNWGPSSSESGLKTRPHIGAGDGRDGSKQEKSGSPTPLDVVLRWVTAPGNYQRWRQERAAKIAHEVVAAMKSAGIADHDAADVRELIALAETQYKVASKWLTKKNLRAEDLVHGRTSDRTQANTEVLKLCPRFFDLVPVFREFNFVQEAPRSDSGSESSDGDDAAPNGSDRGEYADHEGPRVTVRKRQKNETDEEKRPSKRHCQIKEASEGDHPSGQHGRSRASVAGQVLLQELTSQPTPGVLNCTRRTTAHESVLSGGFSSVTGLSLGRCGGAPAQASHIPLYERQLARCKLECELKDAQGCLAAEQRKRECSVGMEQQRVEALRWRAETERWRAESAKTQVESEKVQADANRRRAEMKLRVDGVLSRQDLLAKGIPLEMVDMIIPL